MSLQTRTGVPSLHADSDDGPEDESSDEDKTRSERAPGARW